MLVICSGKGSNLGRWWLQREPSLATHHKSGMNCVLDRVCGCLPPHNPPQMHSICLLLLLTWQDCTYWLLQAVGHLGQQLLHCLAGMHGEVCFEHTCCALPLAGRITRRWRQISAFHHAMLAHKQLLSGIQLLSL
jgi:hypothetical protein